MKRWLFFSVLVSFLFPDVVSGFPQKRIDRISRYVHSLLQQGPLEPPKRPVTISPDQGSEERSRRKMGFGTTNLISIRNSNRLEPGDTLTIGDTPAETLTISGTWFHDGPILVVNDGVLIVKRAQFTNKGSLFVKDSGKVLIDSSFLYFPEEYPYQLAIFLGGKGYLSISSCTTSFGGYAYYLDLRDSAQMEVHNLYQEDFTSSYVRDRSSLTLRGTNLGGEYAVLDSSTVSFTNTTDLILYHHLPSSCSVDFSFPKDTDSLYSYLFDDSQPGIDGIAYRVTVDSSFDVRWGILPSRGSNVRISNSVLRIVGLWFEGSDTISLSGLVNNTHYEDYSLPVSDRTLHLVNTTVQTWNLYPFDTFNLNLSGSIVGEVISKGHSSLNLSSYFLDGSGGVLAATDTSVLVSLLSSVMADIRSEGKANLLLAYSALPFGRILALGSSILILVQSSIQDAPEPFDSSVVWFCNISGPARANVDDTVAIMGSAWIDRGPLQEYVDFGQYQMFYQKLGEATWVPIDSVSAEEVYRDTLALWDTKGLDSGPYIIRLVLKNNIGDSVEALRNINLQTFRVSEGQETSQLMFQAFPTVHSVAISLSLPFRENILLKAFDIQGREVSEVYRGPLSSGTHLLTWKPRTSGIYFLLLSTKGNRRYQKERVLWVRP